MPTPSLLIVPARFKTGRLYSQIPTDNGDFTVTRNTAARRFGPDGLIESVASGIPRLDYYTSGGVTGCPALLVEPAATNLVKYSDQFDTVTSGWSPLNLVTITGNTNATLDPAGGNTADIIVATSGSAEHSLSTAANNLGSVTSGTTLTWSVFAKATNAASGFVQIFLGGFAFSPANSFANFQLTGNGAITTGTYSSASIQPFGNGWYRCSMTTTAAANGTPGAAISPILASGTARSAVFAGNGVDGVYLWGAQLETGSVATSYIPTTAGTGSRSADVISVSGAVSGSIGQTEGTIYVEFEHTSNTAERRLIALSDGTTTNRCFIWALNNTLLMQLRGSSTIIVNPIPTGYNKVAFAYEQNGASGNVFASINGGAIVSGTSSNYFTATLNQVNIGNRENSQADPTLQWNNRIRAAALYTTRLTNAELATLTTP